MKRYDVITLVKRDPKTFGADEEPDEVTRDVFCEVRSIGATQFYDNYVAGIKISYVFVLSQQGEYDDERIIIYKGNKYHVIRTYINKSDAIEITVEPYAGA